MNKENAVLYFQEKYKLSKEEAESVYKDIASAMVDLNFIPQKDKLQVIVSAIVNITNPENPQRNLDNLIDAKFAERALSR